MAFTMHNWEEMQAYVGTLATRIPHREYDEATGQVRDVFDVDRRLRFGTSDKPLGRGSTLTLALRRARFVLEALGGCGETPA
jgi:hypothetical protein